MVHYPSLPELKKALGKNYSIRTIDLEKCLYRDFGNGFNVEISGCSRANRKCPATLYLWFGDRAPDCIIVKTVRDVGRSAEAIGEAVEKLYAYSVRAAHRQRLCEQGQAVLPETQLIRK